MAQTVAEKIVELKLNPDYRGVGESKPLRDAAFTGIDKLTFRKIPIWEVKNGTSRHGAILIKVYDFKGPGEDVVPDETSGKLAPRKSDIDAIKAPYKAQLLAFDASIKKITSDSFNEDMYYYSAIAQKLVSGNTFETKKYLVWKQDPQVETYTIAEE